MILYYNSYIFNVVLLIWKFELRPNKYKNNASPFGNKRMQMTHLELCKFSIIRCFRRSLCHDINLCKNVNFILYLNIYIHIYLRNRNKKYIQIKNPTFLKWSTPRKEKYLKKNRIFYVFVKVLNRHFIKMYK